MKLYKLKRYVTLLPVLFIQVCMAQLPVKNLKIINGNFATIQINSDALINSIKDVKMQDLARKNKIVIQVQSTVKNAPALNKLPGIKMGDPATAFLNSLELITDKVLPPSNTPVYLVINPYDRLGVLQPRYKWIFLVYYGVYWFEQKQYPHFRATSNICFTEPVVFKQMNWNQYEMDFPEVKKGAGNIPYATEYRLSGFPHRNYPSKALNPSIPLKLRMMFLENNGKKGFLGLYDSDKRFISVPLLDLGIAPFPSSESQTFSDYMSFVNVDKLTYYDYTNRRPYDEAHSFLGYQIHHNESVRSSVVYLATSTQPWPSYCTLDKMDHDRDGALKREYGGYDCNDADSNVHPVFYSYWSGNDSCDVAGIDSDCELYVDRYFKDEDRDGYFSEQCFEISTSYLHPELWGKVIRGTDCDDHNPSIIPGRVMYTNDNTYFICGNYDTNGNRVQIAVEPGFRCVRQPDGTGLIMPR